MQKLKWSINNVKYKTLKEAAQVHGVVPNTIMNWSDGTHKLPKCIWECTRLYDKYNVPSGIVAKPKPSPKPKPEPKITKQNGLSTHLLYRIHHNIIDRCYRPDNPNYHLYGGRGITICDEWKDDFLAFYNYCMDNGWEEGLVCDREDTNGNYESDNLRFITQKQNTQNSTVSKIWVIEGREYPSVRDAADGEGVSIGTIQNWCDRKPKPNCHSYKLYPEN